MIVDGCSDSNNISQLFLRKYRELYTSVPYCTVDMQQILAEVDTNLTGDRFSADYVCSSQEVRLATPRLNPHKDDGNAGLSSDYFINAGSDLSVHIAFFVNMHCCSRLRT